MRRARRNPLSTVLSGVGGFVAVPLAAGVVNALAHVRNPEEPPTELAGRGLVANAAAAIGALALGASSSSPALRAALFAGAAGAAIGAVGWAASSPPPLPSPSPYPPQAGATWRELAGSPLRYELGRRYRATVELPFYVPSALASDDAIRKYGADHGFNVTTIARARPDASWPVDDDADLFIEAVATSSGELERPDALTWAALRV